MSARSVYLQRQCLETLIYLEGLITALDARVTVLEGQPLIADITKEEKEEDNGKRHASSERVRHRS